MNRGPRSVRRGAPLQSRLASMVSLALDYTQTGSMVDRRSGVVPYFTRATTASVPGFEKLDYAISGEARMGGMRRVATGAGNSEVLTAAGGWTLSNATSVVGATDPEGGATAYTLTATAGNGYIIRLASSPVAAFASGSRQTVSCWIKRRTGTGTISLMKDDGTASAVTVTSAWQRYSVTVTTTDTQGYVGVLIGTSGDAVDIWHPQNENVTGQANQNPSEYVSVGAAKRNYCTYSEQLNNAAWAATTTTKTADAGIAPDGALTAELLTASAGNGTVIQDLGTLASAAWVGSIYLKRSVGSGNVQLTLDGGSTWTTVAVTTTWTRFEITQTLANPDFGVRIATNADAVFAWGAQVEQGSAASTYFKVENVYPYHGAMVDGVKYFPTENGNTVSSNVVTEGPGPSLNLFASAWRNTDSGVAFTSPASAANSPTDEIKIEFVGAVSDWTPSGYIALVSRYETNTSADAWSLALDTGSTGKLVFVHMNGTTLTAVVSTAAVPFSDYTRGGVAVTWDKTTGDIKFYISLDGGVTWTQLGTTVAGPTTALNAGTRDLTIGVCSDKATQPMLGNVYRAKVYTTIAATEPSVDFNPYSAVEARATNLIIQSQDLSTSWSRSGILAFGSGSTVNAVAAPDGTTTADLMTESSAAASLHSHYQAITVAANTTITVSGYVKRASGTRNIGVTAFTGAGTFNACFDLDVVSVGQSTATGNGSVTTASIAAVGSGWYRFQVTGIPSSSTANPTIYYTMHNSTTVASNTYDGDGASGVYFWGAQAETGSTASAYVPTTTASRNGTSWVSDTGEWWYSYGSASIKKNTIKGLLIEEARTNIVLQSENFGTTWTTAGTSPTRSAAAKTLGSLSLDLLGDDDVAAAERYVQNITFTGDAVKAFSFFFAQGTSTTTQFSIWDNIAAAWRLLGFITWQNGYPVVTMSAGTLLRLEYWGSGVYRLHAQTTSVTAANQHQIDFRIASDGAVTVTLTGNVYLGGVQAENGTEPSSYQPTTTGTVARNADVAAITSLGGWFNTSVGALLAEIVPGNVSATRGIASFDDNSANEVIALGINASAAGTLSIVDGGVAQAALSQGALVNGTAVKVVGAWAANDSALAVAGGAAGTDTSVTMPTPDRLRVGVDQAGNYLNGYIKTLNYYPRRLPNTVLPRLSA